jgi:c-di-GMP-binding flagellar brake protein YcgR
VASIITRNTSSQKDEFVELPTISFGTVIQLVFEGLGSSRSTLIGMEAGKFLIVSTPPIAEIRTKLFKKNHCVIRYLSSGKVYAFRCTLLSIINEPFRISILSYPESIENVNLRKHERISCILDAAVSHLQKMYEGNVRDLSIGGCSFEFSNFDTNAFPEIKIRDKVSIMVQLKQNGDMLRSEAIVRNIRKDMDAMSLGLQFVSSSNVEIGEYVEHELTDYIVAMREGL